MTDARLTAVDALRAIFARHGKTAPVTNWWRFWRPYQYLWIERRGPVWTVFAASGRSGHFAVYGSALAVDFDDATGKRVRRYGMTGAWRSALSMWPVRSERDAARAEALVVDLVHEAARFAGNYRTVQAHARDPEYPALYNAPERTVGKQRVLSRAEADAYLAERVRAS